MLRYIIDGSAEFIVDNEVVMVKKGQVSYIPEDVSFPAGR